MGVLVSAALLGIISLGYSKFLQSISKGSRNIALSGDFQNLLSDLRLIIGHERICSSAFKDSDGNRAKFNPLDNPPSNIDHVKMGERIIAKLNEPSVGLRTLQLSLTHATHLPDVTIEGVDHPRYNVDFKVIVEKGANGTWSSKNLGLVVIREALTGKPGV